MNEPSSASGAAPASAAAGRRTRLADRLRALLARGTTPERLALSVALGAAIGVSPLVGMTTLVCIGLGILLRLNHAATQLANQSMYLVQVPMLVVFVRVGESLVGAPPVPLSMSGLLLLVRESPSSFMAQLGRSALHGMLGWSVLAPLIGSALYAILVPVFRRHRIAH